VSSASFTILSGTPYNVAGFGSTNLTVRFNPPPPVRSATTSSLPATAAGRTSGSRHGRHHTSGELHWDADQRVGAVAGDVTDTSIGTITNRFWNFGDGTTTNTLSTNVVKNYTVAGTNTVTLIASGPVGASTNVRTNYIVVTNIPPSWW